MRKAVIVETNVIAVANKKASHVSPECALNCTAVLLQTSKEFIVVLDAGNRFFEEYFRHANRPGQPGFGDAFVKWLWNNQGYSKHCETVSITQKLADPDDFEEFPGDNDLNSFDRSDRKFVAVALKSSHNPVIYNASDSDWFDFREPLERHGVRIEFICPYLFE